MTKGTERSIQFLDQIKREFYEHADSIDRLLTFDDFVVKDALKYFDDTIKVLEGRLPKNHPFLNAAKAGRKSLSNIRRHSSLRPFYKVIYNQAVVIWVSVLAATLESIFKYLIAKNYPSLPKKKEERKISIGDLRSFENVREAFPDIVLKVDDSISFQDIGSIQRTFDEYFDIHFDDEPHLHNVGFAIKARHAIVHRAGGIDASFRKYAKEKLTKRTVMTDLPKSNLQFELAEAKQISKSFQGFVKNLFSKIREKETIKGPEEEDLPF